MRLSFLLPMASTALVLTAILSCSGRVVREDCFSGGGSTRSGFCDNGGVPPGEESPPFPPNDGFVPPPRCTTMSQLETLSRGLTCAEDRPLGGTPGASCRFASDCATVCCVAGSDGRLRPTPPPDPQADAGADATADASTDASTDASADAEPNADADADAVPDAAAPPFPPRRASVCTCGRCVSPQEACTLANETKGLGGP